MYSICWESFQQKLEIPEMYRIRQFVTSSFLPSLLKITSWWLPMYLRGFSVNDVDPLCCPAVSSLCTVNTATDSWLHPQLWGHYILTRSLFTLSLPPIPSTPLCYLPLPHFVHQSLSLRKIFSLDAFIIGFGENRQPQGSVWFIAFAEKSSKWIDWEQGNKEISSLGVNVSHLLNCCFLNWPALPTLMFLHMVFELVPLRHHCRFLWMTGKQAISVLT